MERGIKGFIQDASYELEMISFLIFAPPSYGRAVNYESAHVRGRSEPYCFYVDTDERVTRFAIEFHSADDELRTIREKERFIESLVVPDYGPTPGQRAAIVKPPHLAVVWIKDLVRVRGTIRNLQVTPHIPIDLATGLPHHIAVAFDLHSQSLSPDQLQGFADLRRVLSRGHGLAG